MTKLISRREFLDRFSKYLRKARSSRGMYQKDLAIRLTKLGVDASESRVSRWFTGRWEPTPESDTIVSPPNLYELYLIGHELGTSSQDIMSELESPIEQDFNVGSAAEIVSDLPLGTSSNQRNSYEQVITGAGTSWTIRTRLLSNSRKVQSAYNQISHLIGTSDVEAIGGIDGANSYSLISALLSSAIELQRVARNNDLERQVADKFSLRRDRVVVAAFTPKTIPVPAHLASSVRVIRSEIIGHLAAAEPEVWETLHQVKAVALTGGQPTACFADHLRPYSSRLSNTKWFSILASLDDLDSSDGTSANAVVSRLAYRQAAGTARIMPYSTRHAANEAIEAVSDVDLAFVSVGAKVDAFNREHHLGSRTRIDQLYKMLTPEEQSRCVGDMLLCFLDRDGHPIRNVKAIAAYQKAVTSASLDQLKGIAQRGCVWLLAEQDSKAEIVRASLIGGYATGLILDGDLAKALIALPDPQKS